MWIIDQRIDEFFWKLKSTVQQLSVDLKMFFIDVFLKSHKEKKQKKDNN